MRADTLPYAAAERPVERTRYGIGIVNYKSYGDLEHCLTSIKGQSLAPGPISVVDADPDFEQLAEIRRLHPEVSVSPRTNHGFAAGANRAIEMLRALAPELDYILILNPDVRLEPDFAESLIAAMDDHSKAGLGSGKLLRPGGILIDSAGIDLPRNRRPRDRGSEEPDCGQYDSTERVFAVSGAVLMLRCAAIEDLTIAGEIFDEDFFMYHEDTDLAWRARNLGWDALYAPGARATHTRHWRPNRRFSIDPTIRRHSFKNHYLQIIKNDRVSALLRDLPAILTWELLRLGFALLRDRAVLRGYRDALRLTGRAWKKRRLIRRRACEIEARSIS